jgi:hypothetical protein
MSEDHKQEAIDKWIKANTEHREWYICPKCSYQAPRFKDEWQGLTEDDALQLLPVMPYEYDVDVEMILKFAEAIEAKLREKNNA